MMLETRARGRLCGFTLRLEDLAQVDEHRTFEHRLSQRTM